MQAKALQQAGVKAAIPLAAMSTLAIFSAPCRVGFSRTRTAVHSLLDRQVHNAQMTVTLAVHTTASGDAGRYPQILCYRKKRCSIWQYLGDIDLGAE